MSENEEENLKGKSASEILSLIQDGVDDTTIEDVPFIGKTLGAVVDVAGDVVDAYKGTKVPIEYPDAKEVTEIDIGFWEDLIPSAKGLFVRSDAGKAEIIKDTYEADERFGGAYVDKFNNPLILWQNKPYYINKPGFTELDFNNVLSEIIKFYPASKFVSGAKNIGGVLKRGIPAYGGTEIANIIAEENIAPEVAKEKNIAERVGEVATSTGIGVGTDIVAPPVAKVVGKGVKAIIPDKLISNLPRLTPEVYETVTKSKFMLTKGQAGTKPPTKADSGDAQAQASRQIMEEDRIRYSKDDGAEILTGFDEAQLDQIRTEADKLTKEMGTGKVVGLEKKDIPIESATSIKNIVSDIADKKQKTARDLYTNNAISQLTITPEGVNRFATNALDNLSELKFGQFTMSQMPLLSKVKSDLTRIKKLSANPRFKQQSFNVLRDYQMQLNSLRKIAQGKNPSSQEALAIDNVKKTLDNFITEGIDNAFIVGDQEIIDNLLKANKSYREYMNLTGQNVRGKDRVQTATNTILQKLTDPRLDADAVVNIFFGHSKFNPPSVMNNVLTEIQKNIPKEQFKEVIALVKDGVLTRAFSGKGDSGVTRTNIVNNYNDIFKRNKNLINRLFSETELNRIKEFKDNVLPTLWAELKMNPPNTANTLLFALMNKGLLNYAGKIPFVGEMVSPQTFKELGTKSRASDAVRGYLQRKKAPLFSTSIQATIRTEDDDDELTKFLDDISSSGKKKILETIDTGDVE